MKKILYLVAKFCALCYALYAVYILITTGETHRTDVFIITPRKPENEAVIENEGHSPTPEDEAKNYAENFGHDPV